MSQCPTCGAILADSAQMCEDCGTDLTQSASPASNVNSQQDICAAPTEPAETAIPPVQTTPAIPGETGSRSQNAARLELKRGGTLSGDSFEFASGAIIGRFDVDTGPVDVDMSLLPESQYLSRQHARISQNEAGQWTVVDLGSSNGTFVLDSATGKFVRISGDHNISDGAEVAFGNARFVFHCG